MQIPCTITREHFADTDRAGRPYTLEFVHYAHAETGRRVRTKAHILPSMTHTTSTPREANETAQQVEARGWSDTREPVYLDADRNPAILVSFGYSRHTARTTQVLTVSDGRVVSAWITPDEFDAHFVESSVPFLVAAHALENIGRAGGMDTAARHYLLLALNAPEWKIALHTYGMIVRNKLARIAQQFN